MTKITRANQERIDRVVRLIHGVSLASIFDVVLPPRRAFSLTVVHSLIHITDTQQLSQPRNLVIAALVGELVFLLCHVVQSYDHTIFFPPSAGRSGTIQSLLHTLFFWFPTLSLDVRYPEFSAFGYNSDIWPAIMWW